MPETADRGIILAIATIASFFVPYLTSSITIALPAIGAEFSLGAVLLGWVMSAHLVGTWRVTPAAYLSGHRYPAGIIPAP